MVWPEVQQNKKEKCLLAMATFLRHTAQWWGLYYVVHNLRMCILLSCPFWVRQFNLSKAQTANEPWKHVCYRFAVNFNNLEKNVAFISRLKWIGQHLNFSENCWSMSGQQRLCLVCPCDEDLRQQHIHNSTYTQQKCMKTAHKYGKGMWKFHSLPPGCLQGLFLQMKVYS